MGRGWNISYYEEDDMPIYEYRCRSCRHKSSVLWRNFSPPESIDCEQCGNGDTTRVISSVAFHKSLSTRLSELDPRYDKMVDAAAASTSEADPNRFLGRDIQRMSEAPEPPSG